MDKKILQLEKTPVILNELKKSRDPFPVAIEIHPTDDCNFTCLDCFARFLRCGVANKERKMGLREYNSLFKQMFELGIHHLSISGGGEPFVDERIIKIIEGAIKNKLSIRIVTNGSLLTEKIIEELILTQEIRLSIDAINPRTYSIIKKCSPSTFYKTINNLRQLINLRKKSNSSLKIGVTFLMNIYNIYEVNEFVHDMLKLDVDSIVIKYNIFMNFESQIKLKKLLKKSLKITGDKRLEIRKPFHIKTKKLKCYMPYFMISCNPYGDIFCCCLKSQGFKNDRYVLGNIRERALEKIWSGSMEKRSRMKNNGVGCKYCNYNDNKLNLSIYSKIREKTFINGEFYE